MTSKDFRRSDQKRQTTHRVRFIAQRPADACLLERPERINRQSYQDNSICFLDSTSVTNRSGRMRGGRLFRQASLLAVLWLMNYQGVAKFTEAKTLVSVRQLLHMWNFKLLCMSDTCLRGKGGRVSGAKTVPVMFL